MYCGPDIVSVKIYIFSKDNRIFSMIRSLHLGVSCLMFYLLLRPTRDEWITTHLLHYVLWYASFVAFEQTLMLFWIVSNLILLQMWLNEMTYDFHVDYSFNTTVLYEGRFLIGWILCCCNPSRGKRVLNPKYSLQSLWSRTRFIV